MLVTALWALLSITGPAAHAATSSAEAIRLLNLQREANGIPGWVVENPQQTTGCRNHNNYMSLNGSFDHGEDPGRPGYTVEGNYGNGAGGWEVLSRGEDGWSERFNPWHNAPIHLALIMDPTISQAGYDESHGYACMRTTRGGRQADVPSAYSHPGPGAREVPWAQTAAERPYVPQQLVGIPYGQETGPNILLFTSAFASASDEKARVVDFSLTGPAGPVEARIVTEETRNEVGDGRWFPDGGVLIPVHPLAPEATYHARVLWQVNDDPGRRLDQRFSFITEARENDVSVNTSPGERSGRFIIEVESDAPDAQVRLVGQSGDRRLGLGAGRHEDVEVPYGRWRICVTSGGPGTGFRHAEGCDDLIASARTKLTVSRKRDRRGRILLSAPPAAVGQQAVVRIRQMRLRCVRYPGGRQCATVPYGRTATRRLTLKRSQRLTVKMASRSRAASVQVKLAPFDRDGVPYSAAQVRRTYRR